MTDLPGPAMSVPNRLGVTARYEADELTLVLTPQPETLHHGVVRASVLSFVIDVVAGITVDRDPDVWTLTTDMTVRTRPFRAPDRILAVGRVVRRGRRSVTCTVDLTDEQGAPFAAGAIGFASIPRKKDDPPKPMVSPADAVHLFGGLPGLTRPLRQEAGIEVVDAANGVVQLDVTPELRNPVGTLQGAMVALLAEAAAEELLATRAESPVVVTDLDLRYLAQAPVGPVRTSARVLDDSPLAPVEVSLVDTSTDRLTTLVYARAALPL
jgi:acyl-coenzyme A thioesterase PaaI-like protein